MVIEKKIKILGAVLGYQLNSTTNSAYSPQKWAKWAELAIVFTWQLQNGPWDFNFFNCHGCRLIIRAYFYCAMSAPIFHA